MENFQESRNAIDKQLEAMSQREKERFTFFLKYAFNGVSSIKEKLFSGDVISPADVAHGSFEDLIKNRFISQAGFVELQNQAVKVTYRLLFDAIKFSLERDPEKLNMLVVHTLAKISTNANSEYFNRFSAITSRCLQIYRYVYDKNVEASEKGGSTDVDQIKPRVSEFLNEVYEDPDVKINVIEELEKFKLKIEEILLVLRANWTAE